jgi:hypothetical protein
VECGRVEARGGCTGEEQDGGPCCVFAFYERRVIGGGGSGVEGGECEVLGDAAVEDYGAFDSGDIFVGSRWLEGRMGVRMGVGLLGRWWWKYWLSCMRWGVRIWRW